MSHAINDSQSLVGAPNRSETMRIRIIALIIAIACAAVLGIAAWLEPSTSGLGTHTQLKMAPCTWILFLDVPCMTCGMTTAFAHAANGNLLASFHAQPLGAVLAIITAMTFLLSVYIVATGSAVMRQFTWLWCARTAWISGGVLLAAWGYKIVAYKGWL